ncbi:hypothetical protein HD553DRAFT_273027 [Filobasidium floriforme]|uniref:uncharacterized protein n=1 Tax=Filobasidium floriforme TaxID=5210 RepID=UPI001E8D4806|nr:uncharacterized protein HD553DRAFT_273027 [Filobasidium floriforme]KAH8083482.1 hypothetical protein HD553DRAFT_273027 [Filobasidium floriforme]
MPPFVIHWGIIGCGWISGEFVKDISIQRDDVTDVYHAIAAVGSRDVSKAQTFIESHCPAGANGQQKGLTDVRPEACGSYDDVYNHPSVDIIYIGTPNTAHFSDAKAALEAGKHCLVEKPACLNAKQWDCLSGLAKSKNLFLMEGMWSRFFPIADVLVQKLHHERVLGDLKFVQSDLSMPFYNLLPDTHRTIAMEYAGGPLYDLGPYILLAPLWLLFRDPKNERTRPSQVTGHMLKARTGVDLSTSVTLSFDRLGAVAVGTTSFAYATSKETKVTIVGDKGEVIVHDGPNNWTKITIRRHEPGESWYQPRWLPEETIEMPVGGGFGLIFEANAVARSIRDGQIENERMPHVETRLALEIINEVQKQGGYKLPAGLEKM